MSLGTSRICHSVLPSDNEILLKVIRRTLRILHMVYAIEDAESAYISRQHQRIQLIRKNKVLDDSSCFALDAVKIKELVLGSSCPKVETVPHAGMRYADMRDM
ncbi:unnamed protein product [Pieris macdunnoughi]|uniref:Uncharacterized protein n=1 Tax=Pieris macdunnoughi TaxID=345717 RepID=A0A821W1T5_9NEOP|nr:unnamed protein product [Pieris macdunnoughi]